VDWEMVIEIRWGFRRSIDIRSVGGIAGSGMAALQ
jgi:hypothetical protein